MHKNVSVREHATEIITFKKKKMKLLTYERQKLCENSKICYTCIKKFKDKPAKDKKYHKVRNIVTMRGI